MDWRDSLATALAESQARELSVYLLGNVPGLPPIVQAFHIFGIAVVMASIVMVDLRFLGLAVPSQNISEMVRRLMPWTWWALLLNAATGSVFVIARPLRYFYNPIFAWKLTFLVPAVALAVIVHRLSLRESGYWESSFGRRIAGRLVAGAARRLRLRHDHGSNYLADDFQQEIAFFGIDSSPSFVREPEGNRRGEVNAPARSTRSVLVRRLRIVAGHDGGSGPVVVKDRPS